MFIIKASSIYTKFEKQIKLLQRKIDFSNFNAGKINIYQHIEDLKNSLTIESLNEDLNLKKEIMQILETIII